MIKSSGSNENTRRTFSLQAINKTDVAHKHVEFKRCHNGLTFD